MFITRICFISNSDPELMEGAQAEITPTFLVFVILTLQQGCASSFATAFNTSYKN